MQGIRIIEVAGIGPGQFCGMLLADMGAELIRIERLSGSDPGASMPAEFNLMNRSRPSIALNLKRSEGVDLVLDLCERADALFEGFRPGVMERLGLGPEDCRKRNQRLVYGRMTGWGQSGPLADTVGHDANYIALTGALYSIGEKGRLPAVPLNLVGDFGGGAMYLAMGLLAAILEASRSGEGQIVDAAMTDGSASLMTLFHGLQGAGRWQETRGSNFLDGAAPFYRSYATKDGKAIVVAAIESRFYQALLEQLGISEIDPARQHDRALWPEHGEILEKVFLSRSRDEWQALLEGSDTCFAPILSMTEATEHPHNVSRGTYVEVDGIKQPAPAPRFSRTPSAIQCPPEPPGSRNTEVLSAWGQSEEKISELEQAGVLAAC